MTDQFDFDALFGVAINRAFTPAEAALALYVFDSEDLRELVREALSEARAKVANPSFEDIAKSAVSKLKAELQVVWEEALHDC